MSMLGLRVGPFEIVERVRVPEPGEWFRARRAGMTRRQPNEVLLRMLPPDASVEARAALQRNHERLSAIDDPRIPKAVAFYEGSGAMAVASVAGVSLSRALEGRRSGSIPMTPATLLDIVVDLAESLQRVHHRGAFHGHVSPEVVWLSTEGRLWIWGFGSPSEESQERWCPPERARGAALGMAADQWALGAMIASLITGHPPWRGEDPAADALRGDPESMVAPVERQWPALGRLLRRMLDPHPQNRFASLHPVRQELLALSRKAGSASGRRELGGILAGELQAAPMEVEPATDAGVPAPILDEQEAEAPEPSAPASEAGEAEETEIATVRPVERANESPDADPPSLVEADLESEAALPSLQGGGDLPAELFDIIAPAADSDDIPVARVGIDAALVKEGPPPVRPNRGEGSGESEPSSASASAAESDAASFVEGAGLGARVTSPSDPSLPSDFGSALAGRPGRDPMDPPTVPPHPDDDLDAPLQASPESGFGSAGPLAAAVVFEETDPEEGGTLGTAIPTGGSGATGVEEPPASDPMSSNWIVEDAPPPSVGDEPALGSFSAALPEDGPMVSGDDSPGVEPLAPSTPQDAFPIRSVAPWLVVLMVVLLIVWTLTRLAG